MWASTFSAGQMAVLACQDQGQWSVQHLATVGATLGTDMRQAWVEALALGLLT